MNLTKKLFVTLIFAGLTILTIQAQPARGEGGDRGGDPTERANRQSEKMIEDLDLSTAQGKKIKEVYIEYANKMQTMRTEARESDAGREGMREKMKALFADQQTAINKYLTADQIEKWEKIQAERPERGGREGRKGKGKGKKKKTS